MLIGAVIGMSWAFALHWNVHFGLLYGAAIGLVFGILFFFFLKAAAGSSHEKEFFFLTASILALVLAVGIGTAFIALMLRLVFF